MNVKKTKTMVECRDATPDVKIKIDGKILEQVKTFKYLGQIISDDGKSEKDILARIQIAKINFLKLKDVLTARTLNLNVRKRIARC